MKYEKVKIIGKDKINYAKSLGLVEIKLDNGEIIKFNDIVEEVFKLRKDLEEAILTLKTVDSELNSKTNKLEKRILDLEVFKLD